MFNLELSRSLVPVLHAAEVVLRNHLFEIVAQSHPDAWSSGKDDWGNPALGCWLDMRIEDRYGKWRLFDRETEKVRAAKDELRREHRQKPSDQREFGTGHLIAALRFGFWTRILDPDYANWRTSEHHLWSNDDIFRSSFPEMQEEPGKRRGIAHSRFTEVKELRNRVFHHEHTRKFTLDKYDRIVEAVAWIRPMTADTLRTSDRPRVERLIQEGPARHRDEIEAAISRLCPAFA